MSFHLDSSIHYIWAARSLGFAKDYCISLPMTPCIIITEPKINESLFGHVSVFLSAIGSFDAYTIYVRPFVTIFMDHNHYFGLCVLELPT